MSANGPASQQKPNYTMSYLPDFVKGFALPKAEKEEFFKTFPLDKKRQFSAFVKEVFAIAKSKEISNNDAIAIIGHREAYLTEIQRLEEEKQRLLAENEARLDHYSLLLSERLKDISCSSASTAIVVSTPSQRLQPTQARSKPQAPDAEVNALSDGLSNLVLNRNSSTSSSAAAAAVVIPTASNSALPPRISKPAAPAVKLQLPPLPNTSPLKPKAPAAVKPPIPNSTLQFSARAAVSSVTVANAVVDQPARTFLVKAPAKVSAKQAAAVPRSLPQTPPTTCHVMMTPLRASAIAVPGPKMK